MNKEIAEKWIARLTAEDAPEQAKGNLGKTDGSRCCLGVLCDIAVEEGVIPKPATPDTVILCYGEETTTLPHSVMSWAGMSSRNGHYPPKDRWLSTQAGALSHDNDRGYTFKEIAATLTMNVNEL